MSEHRNSAFRIKEILTRASKLHESATVEVWKKSFGLEELNGSTLQFTISQNLHLLHEEIELCKRTNERNEFFFQSLFSTS